jgi:hypothetical protein
MRHTWLPLTLWRGRERGGWRAAIDGNTRPPVLDQST